MISISSIIVFFILVLDCLTSISHVRLNKTSKPRVSLEKCKKFSQIDYLPMSSFGFIKSLSLSMNNASVLMLRSILFQSFICLVSHISLVLSRLPYISSLTEH